MDVEHDARAGQGGYVVASRQSTWLLSVAVLALAGCASSADSHAANSVSARASSHSFASQTAAPHTASKPPRLTSTGKLLEHFEGLLRERIGHQSVCGYQNAQTGKLDFRSQRRDHDCTPLSKYFAYRFVFASARTGGLRLYDKRVRGSWPDAYFVTLNGKYVSCGTNPLRLLMHVNNQPDFTLDCASKL